MNAYYAPNANSAMFRSLLARIPIVFKPDAGSFSSQRSVPARRIEGTCVCGCNGGRGLKPLFAFEMHTDDKGRKVRRQTADIRLDDDGRPMARYVLVCKNDLQALQDNQLALNADRAWKKDRSERLAAERAR